MSQTCHCSVEPPGSKRITCDRPVSDARVCAHCAGERDDCGDPNCQLPHLATDLGAIPELVDELWTVVGRQARYSDRVGGSNDEHPLLTNRHVGTLLGSLRNTLTTWIRVVVDERGAQPPRAATQRRAGTNGYHRTHTTVQPLTEALRRCEYSDLPTTDCHHCRERMTA